MRSCSFGWVETCRPQELPQNPEDSQKQNPERLISSLPMLSQDAARLGMCANSSSGSRILPPACLDSRRATAPRSHPNIAVCSRHRIMPQRTAHVGKISSTQVETCFPESSVLAKGNLDAGSPPQPFSTGRMASR